MTTVVGSVEGSGVVADVSRYLDAAMAALTVALPEDATTINPHLVDEGLADTLFGILTSRRFCYMGRTRTQQYRASTVELIQRRVERGEPLRLFYDIGPGYHASVRPGVTGLRFDVGLSELLILHQIATLHDAVAEHYAPSVRFWLIVDNVCALRTNDIALHLTQGFCERLRTLIRETGLEKTVELIVESEHVDLEEYDELVARRTVEPLPTVPSPQDVENVARFLGRTCDATEALERIERYRRTGPVTDLLMDRLIGGVHMTQRATGATLGFRPFPGGDARTQSGEVALVSARKGGVRPALITSRNIDAYDVEIMRFPGLLPPSIDSVWYAEPRDASAPA
jgi:hypothetical protein